VPALRPCIRCGRLNRGRPYCAEHEPRRQSPNSLDRPSPAARRRAKRRAGFRCEDCGEPGTPENPLEVDAVLPVSEGGDHGDVNVRVRCRRCHRQKTRADAARRRGQEDP
jgi:5-methylcytosine-specific restriction endonuclease McrA